MARKPTQKTIQLHSQCSCGYNCVEQFPSDRPLKEIRLIGFGLRKIAEKVYSLQAKITCDYCLPF